MKWCTSDILPEEYVTVLVWDGQEMTTAVYDDGDWLPDAMIDPITHWRNLPEPPKGDT
jgi:hypothetical protein